MLIAFDIGNSDITMGLWNGTDWQVWRIPSRTDQPELFYGIKIRDSLLEANVSIDNIDIIVISSVVPGLTDKIKNVVRSLFKREPIILGPAVYDKLPLEVLNPFEIGSDLVSNAMAAFSKFKQTCIVVDFGTALTFTTVSGEGKILGVSIVPGLRTAVRALSQNTAKLFDVPLEMPTSALGRNTVTAIQSGIVIGYEGLVKSVVLAIRKELKTECPAVATGGLSFVITSLKGFFHTVDPQLTLDGLRIIGEILSEKKS
ncbi:MAG: type III pantothenate kinase [Cyclobacteriaceae bacterium]|nr:type III pantothenate kinase [Cyclobacteriaceae bacterium]